MARDYRSTTFPYESTQPIIRVADRRIQGGVPLGRIGNASRM